MFINHKNRLAIRKKQAGTAAVELGLLMVVLVPLAFGITEYGRAMYQYNTLVKSVRDATRYLTQGAPGAANDPAAQCLVVYGRTTCASTDTDKLLPGLTTSMVSVCDAARVACQPTHLAQSTGTGVVNLVTVTVTGYGFASLVPAYVPSFTFDTISATMRQY
jgi:Flp pilus assembly protein TadG